MNKPVYIETVSGQLIDLTAPEYDNLSIEDVFEGLARIQRFNGRSRVFGDGVSVLQHSYAMYLHFKHTLGANDSRCLYALLHDAHESLVGDIPSPLSTKMDSFDLFLGDVQRKVNHRFGSKIISSDEVKRVDRLACAVEWSEFIVTDDEARQRNGEYYGWSPKLVELPEYGQYLLTLNKVREMTTTNIVENCCYVIYKHLATKYLNQEH